MITSPPRQSKRIIAVRRHDDTLRLQTEYGCIYISLAAAGIFHVRHMPAEALPEIDRFGIVYNKTTADWTWKETETAITIYAAGYSMVIHRTTASICCYNKAGDPLYRERDEESRNFMKFDVYKPAGQGDAGIQYIDTPDGKKPVIGATPQVMARTLYKTQLHLTVSPEELLFGLGQNDRGDWNLCGTTQYLHQANMKISIPVLVSSKSYGLLLNTYAPVLFTEHSGTASFYSEGDTALDYYILLGDTLDELVAGYRLLTGKASMLPKWAYGYIQSLERYETDRDLTETVAEYRRRKIGLDCIVLDWNSWEDGKWGQKTLDPARFPDPPALTQALHDMQAKLMVSIWPSFSEAAEDCRELQAAGKMLPMSNCYDAFDPIAREVYWKQANTGLFQNGIDAWWCDNCEPVTPEWNHVCEPSQHMVYDEYLTQSSAVMPYELCNAYSLYHSSGVYEGQRRVNPGKRVMNLTRSAYLGQQRYGTVCWSGDISAKWEVLRRQIAAGLQFCVTGNPYWTLDIGAFFVKKGLNWFWDGDFPAGNQDLGYRELYTRWYQLGAFLPMFRSHGTDTRREIWHFGEEGSLFYTALITANRLRYRLLPTIYSYAGQVWLKDFTVMRMLAFDFPQDKRALQIKDQFMFGRDLLVCPVTHPMYYGPGSAALADVAKERQVYLPAGTEWVNFNTGESYTGGRDYTIDAPIHTIPLFVRRGSILITGEAQETVEDRRDAPLTIHIFSGKDARFLYYDDAHDGYGYEKGAYFTIPIHWNEAVKELSLGASQGDFFQQVQKISVHTIIDGKSGPSFDYTGTQLTLACS